MSQHLWIIFVFLAVPHIRAQSGVYTVVAPKTLRPNLPYNVGISVDAETAVTVVVSIKATLSSGGSSSSTQQSVIDPGQSQLVTLQVGDLIDGGTYNLVVRGTGGLNFENSTELTFSSKSSSIIIQNDKPIYKPGELVQFRVLLLDRALRPKGPGPLNILIKDSQGNVIKQWQNAIAQRGLFSSELQLSSEPNLGDWRIEVTLKNQKESHSFTIAQYVLPKFNVDIDLPAYSTFSESKINARVRATYVYGEPVKGECVISAYPLIHSSYLQPVFTGVARKTVRINGETDIEFDLTKELQLTDDYQRIINIEATVTEALTGRQQNISKSITLHKYPYKLEIIKGSQSFKPGLPYAITIKVAMQDDVPVLDTDPRALKVKHGFSYNHDDFENTTYPIPPNGLVTLTFDPPKNDSINVLGIEATYKELTEWFPVVQRALSVSNTYIQTTIRTEKPKVNGEVEVEVEATAPISSLNYDLLGRGALLISKRVSVPSPTNKLNFRILAPPNAAPKATLIVYMLYENEIIADSIEFNVLGSLDNYLNLTLSNTRREPGEEVEIVVVSRPNSLIGLKGIDQSVLILKQDKDINANTIDNELNSWSTDKDGRTRNRRSLFTPQGSSTASQVFEDSGVVVMTNALVHQQPPIGTSKSQSAKAHRRPVRPFFGSSVHSSSLRPDIGPAIPYDGPTRGPLAGPYAFSRIPRPSRLSPHRIFLSNINQLPAPTWIFDNTSSGYDGRAIIKKNVPDTITSWVLSGFSLDPVYGLGILDVPMKLKVFRPFFISLNIPYSVVKGEVIGIQVLVHNYMVRDAEAEVTLDNSANQFTFTQDENEVEARLELFRSEKVTVKSNSVGSVTFLITPNKLGLVDLNVKATSRVAGDSIVKLLKVRPPGQPQKLNKAALVDLKTGPYAVNLTSRFPPKRVNESDFVRFSIVADILGPSFGNLDNLLEMPFGCGEQNMIKFVPDIVILEYLQSTRKLTEPIRQKAINFLETGYQRELSFKHEDGSFSAFGFSDASGSTWLTAFVVRSFVAAKPHIYVEKEIISKALNWLISKQSTSGSFPEVGKLFDTDLAGSSSKGLALTAYVALALIEADADREIETNARFSSAINLALDYISRGLDGLEDPYALSLISYALHLSNHPLKQGAFNLLESMAIVTDDGEMKHWESVKTTLDEKNPWAKNPKPISVEITSYALLTYIHRNLIGDSIPLVRWLLGQRNAQGGFISTQDTIVGIAALAKFAKATQSPTTNMNIDISYEGGSQSFQVNNDNTIVLQEVTLPPSTRWVNVECTGTGMGIVQLSWGYNLEVTGAWPLFNLDPQVDRTSTGSQLHLSVCTSFVGGNQSNMAVMEVNVPTGYAINTDKLPNLLHYPEIKRFDTEDSDSKLVVYFDSLNKSREVCPTVSAYRVFPVAKQAASYVTVYDYYDSSRRARQFYDASKTMICDICDERQCSQDCLVARQRQAEVEANRDKNPSSANNNRLTLSPVLSFVLIVFTRFHLEL